MKTTFSDIPTAHAFLENYLGAEIAQRIDWRGLQCESTSFIDEQFAESESDLLYTVPIDGQNAFVYILLEHQSTKDPLIAFRLLAYMVRIWEDFLRNNPKAKKLPPILPIVLSQGHKPWKSSTRFSSIVRSPRGLDAVVKRHSPDFEFQLIDSSTWHESPSIKSSERPWAF